MKYLYQYFSCDLEINIASTQYILDNEEFTIQFDISGKESLIEFNNILYNLTLCETYQYISSV
jgi:hypothetical protein